MSFPFTHLRVHSDYSLGTAPSKVEALVSCAKAHGQPAMALTDVRNLHGAMLLSKAAAAAGVQPLVGVQIYLKVGTKGASGSLLLLAQNEKGYANLCRLHNLSITPGRQPEQSIDGAAWKAIIEAEGRGSSITEGVIAIGGVGADGFLAASYKNHVPPEEIVKFVKLLAGRFKNRFYIEICRNGYPEEFDSLNERRALELARDLALPIIATTDVWYADPSRHDAYEILRTVSSDLKGTTVEVGGSGIVSKSQRRYHMRSSEEMLSLFDDLPEAYQNACTIARRCAFKVNGRKPILPPFPMEVDGRTEAEEMRIQSIEGLEQRFERHAIAEADRPAYVERIEYELGIIEKMGFPGYFLIVSDFIKWAKSQGIPVGPGRGSGAGSVVAWALTITDLDPLRFGLLFERFLNPDRVSMPDFDIDFCQDRREEVIEYVRDKYGADRVAQIATFGKIKSKTALKDAGRVITTPYGTMTPFVSNKLTSLIPKEPDSADPMGLQDAYKSSQEFRDAINESDVAKIVFEYALKIEGLNRNAGVHAAGVVIGKDPLTDLIPVGFDPKKGGAVVQFDMKNAEAVGLVKFDFLGLKTLSVINEAVELIRQTTGEVIDVGNLPYEDEGVYKMLAEGNSNGVFQLESDGMKRQLRLIKPTSIEDLIAIVSLFRPGPMEMIPTYAEQKAHVERTGEHLDDWYPEPVDRTKKFLGETYGIMVYQEQVMQVAQVVAGYSLGGADLLRRAMGKKIKSEMDAQKEEFCKGAEANGTPAKKAAALFDLIEKFSGYGFNKSHAAAYAAVAFQTAWLKHHYPAQFFSALMSYETDSPLKMAMIKSDMDKSGLQLLPPDINRSHMRFRPEQDAEGGWHVRFGLTAIKQITPNPDFLAERARGDFKDLIDFNDRAGNSFSSSQLLKLVEAGAFVGITPGGVRRRSASILKFLAGSSKSKDTGTVSMFDTLDAHIVIPKKELEVEEWRDADKLEFDAVGFYFRGHPLDAMDERMKLSGGVRTKEAITVYMANKQMADFDNRKVRGMVDSIKRENGHDGRKPRLALKLAERSDSYWIHIFPSRDRDIDDIYAKLEGAKLGRNPIVVVAKFVTREDGFSIYGNHVYLEEDYANHAMSTGNVQIVVDTSRMDLGPKKLVAAMEELAERARKIDADPHELLRLAAETLQERILQLLDDLKRNLETCAVEGQNGQTITIKLVNRLAGFQNIKAVELPGSYRIDGPARMNIGQISGIMNIQESEYVAQEAVPTQTLQSFSNLDAAQQESGEEEEVA